MTTEDVRAKFVRNSNRGISAVVLLTSHDEWNRHALHERAVTKQDGISMTRTACVSVMASAHRSPAGRHGNGEHGPAVDVTLRLLDGVRDGAHYPHAIDGIDKLRALPQLLRWQPDALRGRRMAPSSFIRAPRPSRLCASGSRRPCAEACRRLEDDGGLVDPALLGAGLDHRVLSDAMTAIGKSTTSRRRIRRHGTPVSPSTA